MWMIVGAVVVLALVVLRTSFTVIHVVGSSMLPTYRDGARLFARRLRGGRIERRDIVAFLPPEGYRQFEDVAYRLKRVVAIAGDPAPVWLAPGGRVPVGKLVVLGDNPNSEDSRRYGYVDVSAVVAIIRNGCTRRSCGAGSARRSE